MAEELRIVSIGQGRQLWDEAAAAGQSVSRGQVIGYIGHSGRTTGNHVHYEVRIHNTPVNPHKYLRDTLIASAL